VFAKMDAFKVRWEKVAKLPMKRIYILGVNGNARDVLETISLLAKQQPGFPTVGGFLDDRIAVGTRVDGVPVCGKIADATKLSNACFVNAIGSPESYLHKADILRKSGIVPKDFVTVIHPSAAVSSSAKIDKGSVILSHVSVGAGVRVGRHVMVLQNCVLSHDSVLEEGAVLATGVRLSGEVHVGKGAYLGSSVVVRGGLKIGARALVGLGAVVTKNIPSDEIWCGNPARFLRAISK